jgi:hypothetical protein
MGVAPRSNRLATHNLEREPRSTFVGHTAVDEACEIGMRQSRENAPLAQKSRMHIVKIKTPPDQLNRDFLCEVITLALGGRPSSLSTTS